MSREPIAPETFELLGQIMSANASMVAHTTDQLMSYDNDLIIELAQTIVSINRVLDEALVIDRRTEERLARLRPAMGHAYSILNDRRSDR